MKAFTQHRVSRTGSALLIILAFILLLSIIATAFLSKALLEKTVSNASSDQTRTDVFAAGAVDAILSDCQQEIGAGSKTPTTTPAVYIPNSAKTIVPSRTGVGSSNSTMALVFSAMPNLVKCSAGGVNFYPNGDATDFPNAAAFPPSEKTFAAADPNDSTSIASLNGRSYPAVRWNQALLLPKKTSTSSTDFTPITGFTVPDWILVQRDGTNPTAWSTSLCIASPTDVTTTNKNPVVGRYAYTIYDEGGLLDMNVTGYPSVAGLTSMPQHYYRSSLASVDLMQLMPAAGQPAYFPSTGNLLKPGNPIIDSLVGWRNGATLQIAGAVGSYTFNTPTPTSYFQNVQPSGTGFLHVTTPSTPSALTGGASNGQSDRKFSSRQQLIDLMLNGIAPAVVNAGYVQTLSVTQANMQNALQYLGTFSRDLSQPSFQPDSGRPRMTAGVSGDPASNGGNAAASEDALNAINVAFPTTLVKVAFTRNDGSTANVGDPLVKRRFALNRLAWLTYLGPIADDAGNLNNSSTSALYTAGNAASFTAIINALENTYGLSPQFLALGGPTNIANYFGLTWVKDTAGDGRYKWFYNVHNNSAGTGKGIIRELGGSNGIAATGDGNAHDPDFFELLKASMLAGSKAKTLTYLTSPSYPSDAFNPLREQYNFDVSYDYAVLQVGANIIDQFDTDSFATEIVFDNGAASTSVADNDGTNEPKIIRGVENLPYLYRVRMGEMILRNPNVVVKDAVIKSATTPVTSTVGYPGFKDTGVGGLMQIPEIWNPYDVNAPMGTNVVAYPSSSAGQTFRLVVDSADPSSVAAGTTGNYASFGAKGSNTYANSPLNQGANDSVNANAGPVFSYKPFGLGGAMGWTNSQPMNPGNTELDFNPPTNAAAGLYREPTMLVRPNVPAGSGLKYGGFTTNNYFQIYNSKTNLCYSASLGGFIADSSNANPLNQSPTPAVNAYLGVMMGIYPLQWAISSGTNNYIYDATLAAPTTTTGTTYATYRMQYRDPNTANSGYANNWVTYDEKYIMTASSWLNGNNGYLVDGQTSTALGDNTGSPSTSTRVLTARQQSGLWQSFADPRTSRFGTFDFTGGYVTTSGNNYYSSPQSWLDTNNCVMTSDRPDANVGFGSDTSTTNRYQYFAPGWTGYNNTVWWGTTSVNTESQTTGANGYRYGYVTQGIANDTAPSGAANQNVSAYYSDPDGVVRRAMGGEVGGNSTSPTWLYGYPAATATYGYKGVQQFQSQSRPYILNRPFNSVGELGYVFSGTPWKNLDFSNPESGDSGLLDVFCVNDTDDPNALVAGRVNLNTQQVPVLAAILAEAYYNDQSSFVTGNGGYINSKDLLSTTAYPNASFNLASYLVNGPTGSTGTAVTPLLSTRDLVGKWVGSTTTAPVDGTLPGNFAGFSSDISSFYNPSSGAGASYLNANNTRLREAAVRALSAVGQTRVWNLMIDVVAQTGRYPATATDASKFLVEGERRYWVHVAIDRYTGNILDRQIEEVRQ